MLKECIKVVNGKKTPPGVESGGDDDVLELIHDTIKGAYRTREFLVYIFGLFRHRASQ